MGLRAGRSGVIGGSLGRASEAGSEWRSEAGLGGRHQKCSEVEVGIGGLAAGFHPVPVPHIPPACQVALACVPAGDRRWPAAPTRLSLHSGHSGVCEGAGSARLRGRDQGPLKIVISGGDRA